MIEKLINNDDNTTKSKCVFNLEIIKKLKLQN